MAVISAEIIYIGNDNYVELSSLKNKATDAYINDAAVTATVKDQTGTDVTGQSWPVTMAYVSGSNGTYRGTLEDGLDLEHNDFYTTFFDVVGDGLTGHWEVHTEAQIRR